MIRIGSRWHGCVMAKLRTARSFGIWFSFRIPNKSAPNCSKFALKTLQWRATSLPCIIVPYISLLCISLLCISLPCISIAILLTACYVTRTKNQGNTHLKYSSAADVPLLPSVTVLNFRTELHSPVFHSPSHRVQGRLLIENEAKKKCSAQAINKL